MNPSFELAFLFLLWAPDLIVAVHFQIFTGCLDGFVRLFDLRRLESFAAGMAGMGGMGGTGGILGRSAAGPSGSGSVVGMGGGGLSGSRSKGGGKGGGFGGPGFGGPGEDMGYGMGSTSFADTQGLVTALAVSECVNSD